MEATETKVCSMCGESKSLSQYRSRGGNQRHLLKSRCNHCLYNEHKKWIDKNPDKVREYRAKDPWTLLKRCKRHGISVEEFWSIYEEQDGTCPICDKEVEAEESAIDHNHVSGDVRGILCKKCNRGLGLLGDSPVNMRRAFDYLNKNGHYGD